uniref:Uncharacterized protein n=1 Tax=Solanum tuberosum TaxID=4113 RepID=M1DZC1_SOLTU
MLETLELKFCDDVDYVHIVSPKLVNLSMLSSYAITFQCFNVNPIFRKITHLCLDGSSLKNLGLVCVSDWLDVSLNLQSLKICDLKISLKRIICALCLLRNSPNLIELDIDEVVKVDKTVYHTTELFDYLSKAEKEVSEALKMVRTVRIADHSAPLVEIADQLGDPSFCRFHRRLALSFSIIVFWIIGRHSITSWNCLATYRLLLFTVDFILYIRAQHTETKGEDKTFWRLTKWVQRFSDLHFFVLSAAFVPFCYVVSMFSLKLQIPET